VRAQSRLPRIGLSLLGALLWALGGARPAAAEPLDPADPSAWRIPAPDLHALAVEGDTLCAVGYWGSVLVSWDRGERFERVRTPVREALFAVDFADADHGFAVGARGTILKTSDAGRSWSRLPVTLPDEFGEELPLELSLFGVSAISTTNVWAVGDGGLVLHSSDGSSWTRIPVDEAVFADDNLTERILNDIQFADASSGWIAGEFGTVLRSRDGGRSWARHAHVGASENDPYLFAVSAGSQAGSGPPVATVGLAGRIWIADATGTRWIEKTMPGQESLYAIAQSGPRLVAVGDRGAIYVSQDSGASWVAATRPRVLGWLRAVRFAPTGTLFAVGAGGTLLRSDDGGSSFTRVSVGDPRPRGSLASNAADLPGAAAPSPVPGAGALPVSE